MITIKKHSSDPPKGETRTKNAVDFTNFLFSIPLRGQETSLKKGDHFSTEIGCYKIVFINMFFDMSKLLFAIRGDQETSVNPHISKNGNHFCTVIWARQTLFVKLFYGFHQLFLWLSLLGVREKVSAPNIYV